MRCDSDKQVHCHRNNDMCRLGFVYLIDNFLIILLPKGHHQSKVFTTILTLLAKLAHRGRNKTDLSDMYMYMENYNDSTKKGDNKDQIQ